MRQNNQLIITPVIAQYLNSLASKYSLIRAIWLIGSRANNTEKENSDWDFVVFADLEVLNSMRTDHSLRTNGIDLLVVFNESGDFMTPWDSPPKKGNLADWDWCELTSRSAKYKSVKWRSDCEDGKVSDIYGNIVEQTVNAYKVWGP